MTIDENDLRKMLNDDDDDDDNDREGCLLKNKSFIPSFMLEILKMKSGALADSLKLSIDLYKAIEGDQNGGKKDEVFKFIKHILTETKDSINQYDYLVALIETKDDDDEKGK